MFISNNEVKQYAPYIKFKNDCTFDLTTNCSTLITGVNGIGKSTLLTYIFKMYDNEFKIYYLPQRLIHFKGASVEDIVNIVEEGYGYQKNPYELMKFLGLKKKKTTKFSRLSGGEKQKVMIAIAFSCIADLLLLDEPLNNLDASTIDSFNKLVDECIYPLLIVSHQYLPTNEEVILDV